MTISLEQFQRERVALGCLVMAEEKISAALQQTVRAAAILGSNDLAFHKSLDHEFSVSMNGCLQRLLGLTSSLLNYASQEEFPTLQDDEDVNARWGDIIDTVDSLLERTDSSLEELTAKARKEKEEAAVQLSTKQEKAPLPANLRNAQDLPHPQLKFNRRPDNTDDPWHPLLSYKVNAKLSLEESLTRLREVDGVQRTGHPYAYEIDNIEYPDFVFETKEPVMYHNIEETTPTWVDTEDKLKSMLDSLRNAREIAIDLEHHDFHSFRGFVCLMQVSDRHQDWIVDTLALREELIVLNEVFTDPKILKVFHGANSDIIWLQRDFGLYIVNLFDTYHASKALGLDGHGLAFLLQKYVNFEADKRYQLADWRIRPLPKEMLYYARSDTHYLLYIYDLMRNELLEKSHSGTHNAMAAVLYASSEVSLRQYNKEPYDAAEGQGSDGWQFLLHRFYGTRAFGPQQLEVVKALHQWRDQKAREKDESTRFVMPNQAIVSVAAAMPKDLNSLLGSSKQISSTMQANLKGLLKVIESAITHANLNEERLRQDDRASESVQSTTTMTSIATKSYQPRNLSTTYSSAKPDDLIATHSSFWGPLADTIRSTPIESPLKDLRLSVPLPALADEVYETGKSSIDPTPTVGAGASEPHVDDDVFVIRDIKKNQAAKRKSEVIEIQDSSPSEEFSQTKQERKKVKKARNENVQAPEQQQEEVFDYAAQPSILKEKEFKKAKSKKFGEFQGKIVRSKQVQGGKQSTFKR